MPGPRERFSGAEGLYSSHIVEWRRARDVGALRELTPKLRRSKRTAESREIERLRRRNERLEDQLQKHKQVLEIQGKASELLSRLLAESTEETTQQPDRRGAVSEACFKAIEPLLGTKAACAAVGRPRATHYRRQKPGRMTPEEAPSGSREQDQRHRAR